MAGRANIRATQRDNGTRLISSGDAVICRTIPIMLMARQNMPAIIRTETLITLLALRIVIAVFMSFFVSS
jgi:hypothetical protein